MHIEGPWLSTNGKRKSKVKYRSAEAKRQAEQLEKDWDSIKKKHGVTKSSKKQPNVVVELPTTAKVYVRTTEHHKSLNSWTTGVVSSKQPQKYTGDKILGIATMSKSNAVPVFNSEHAVDIAKMRR